MGYQNVHSVRLPQQLIIYQCPFILLGGVKSLAPKNSNPSQGLNLDSQFAVHCTDHQTNLYASYNGAWP